MFKVVALGALLLVADAVHAEEPPVRDPMRPFASVVGPGGAASAASRPRFTLTGIVIGASRRIAIVNGKPYVQGETVDGAEIVAVEPGVVRLRERGAEMVLSLSRVDSARLPSTQGEVAQ